MFDQEFSKRRKVEHLEPEPQPNTTPSSSQRTETNDMVVDNPVNTPHKPIMSREDIKNFIDFTPRAKLCLENSKELEKKVIELQHQLTAQQMELNSKSQRLEEALQALKEKEEQETAQESQLSKHYAELVESKRRSERLERELERLSMTLTSERELASENVEEIRKRQEYLESSLKTSQEENEHLQVILKKKNEKWIEMEEQNIKLKTEMDSNQLKLAQLQREHELEKANIFQSMESNRSSLILDMEKEIQVLKDTITNLQNDRLLESESLKELQQIRIKEAQELTVARETSRQLQLDSTALMEQMQDIVIERDSLQIQFQNLKQQMDQNQFSTETRETRIQSLELDLQNLQDELQQKQQTIRTFEEQSSRKHQELIILQQEQTKLKETIQEMTQQLLDNEEEIRKLGNKTNQAEMDLYFCMVDKEEYRRNYDTLSSEHEDLMNKLMASCTDKIKLTEQTEEQEKKIAELSQMCSELQHNCQFKDREVLQLRRDIEVMDKNSKIMTQQLNQLSNTANDASILRTQVTNLESRLMDSQNMIHSLQQELQKSKCENIQLQERVNHSAETIRMTEKQLEKATHQFEVVSAELAAFRSDIGNQHFAWESKHSEWAADREKKAAELGELRQKIVSMEENIQKRDMEIERLRCTESDKVVSLQTSLQQQTNRSNELQIQLDQLKEMNACTMAELNAERRSHQELVDRLKHMENNSVDRNQAAHELQTLLIQRDAEINQLSSELKQESSRLDHLRAELSQRQTTIVEQQAKLRSLQTEIEALQLSNNELKKETETTKNKASEAFHQYNEMKQKIDSIVEECAKYKQKEALFNIELSKAVALKDEVQTHLNKKLEESLAKQSKKYEKMIKFHEEKYKLLKEKVKERNEEAYLRESMARQSTRQSNFQPNSMKPNETSPIRPSGGFVIPDDRVVVKTESKRVPLSLIKNEPEY
eukprot:NODE_214_length_3219_cov_4.395995_g185_i0.p1 GENE.NODE_214_length_3219_cov_4.395995_g185_i0~~NODE_214_length_3219_cov_4.395995_g185_i0.p1  ORF type:complete len:1032 (+),score=299.42 NODE_214_length_3219_cov_4.395995_g185_i0:266-3097(+)